MPAAVSFETDSSDRRWHRMVDQQGQPPSLTPLDELRDQAMRARRLAIALGNDPVARRLEQLADELDAAIARLSQLDSSGS
jgi:hypothetical protein